MNAQKDLHLRPTCHNLRHKMMYVDERQAVPGMIDDSSGTRVFFCLKTMAALGPDIEPANPVDCRPDRPCYCR